MITPTDATEQITNVKNTIFAIGVEVITTSTIFNPPDEARIGYMNIPLYIIW
jgi:hypothetical protein